MNEKQLKHLFCSSLASGHIKGNDLIPTAHARLRVIEEAHFRSFDLLIASISRVHQDTQLNYNNLLVRTQLLERFARTEKCRIDQVRFFPVEIKSDEDVLDERLPNQILDAVLTFGLSILVLDKNHSAKAKRLAKLLPATIISYTGEGDDFEVLSKFDRFVLAGPLGIDVTGLAKILGNASAKTHARLAALQHILEKLTFNQLFLENTLNLEELEFLKALVDVPIPPGPKKRLKKIIKEGSNSKLTDYI